MGGDEVGGSIVRPKSGSCDGLALKPPCIIELESNSLPPPAVDVCEGNSPRVP